MPVAHSTHHEHKAHAPKSIGCMVITCSDTRTPDTDTSGQLIQKLLKEQGHAIAAYHLVKDEPAQIKARITEATANDQVQAIIINGGTGISRRRRAGTRDCRAGWGMSRCWAGSSRRRIR